MLWKDRFWIIGLFGFAKSQPIELHIVVDVGMSIDCHIGQSVWLSWPKVISPKAVGLHHQHCQWWHYCLLYKALHII